MRLPRAEFSPMDMVALRQMVGRGEGRYLEFKRKVNHPEKIVRELIAFANTDGGTLLVGVDDDGTIYGSKRPQEDEFDLRQTIDRVVAPRIKVQITFVPVNSRRAVLLLYVRPSRLRPHFYRPDGPGTPKTAYVRVEDMTVKASRELVRLLRQQRQKKNVSLPVTPPTQAVLQYLEEHPDITLAEARILLKTSEQEVSTLLVRMASAGLLHLRPGQQGDRFVLASESFLG